MSRSSTVVAPVAPTPLFEVLDGSGRIVERAETHPCPPCHGSGKGFDLFPARRTCQTCRGSGRLAGGDEFVWPVAVRRLSAEEAAAHRDEAA